jgi:hypothetical protein
MKSSKTTEPEWEGPRQSGEAIGCSRAHVYVLIARGLLDARKLGRRTIISVASRRSYIESLPKAQIALPKPPALKQA